MWASVQNSITAAGDDPIGAASSGADAVLGPSYDYLKDIQSPSKKGVSSAGTMDQVFTNTGAIAGYVNNLILGPKMGNQLFSDTGGKCKAPDGTVVHRWTWINNRMGADDAAAILGPSFQNAVGGSGVDGIVPGIGGDIAAMNPLKIMNAMVLDGVPPCQAFTCPITDAGGADRGTQTHFMSPSLELNMNGCKPSSGPDAQVALKDDAARMNAAAAKKGESFAPYFPSSYGPNVLVNTDPTPGVVLGIAVALFVGYVATHIR
uniref:Uncharacterized protein n=1 Tax=viral metagenome TaxID=1070528 RepID=A0A6C0HLC1_9ZZZZ